MKTIRIGKELYECLDNQTKSVRVEILIEKRRYYWFKAHGIEAITVVLWEIKENTKKCRFETKKRKKIKYFYSTLPVNEPTTLCVKSVSEFV